MNIWAHSLSEAELISHTWGCKLFVCAEVGSDALLKRFPVEITDCFLSTLEQQGGVLVDTVPGSQGQVVFEAPLPCYHQHCVPQCERKVAIWDSKACIINRTILLEDDHETRLSSSLLASGNNVGTHFLYALCLGGFFRWIMKFSAICLKEKGVLHLIWSTSIFWNNIYLWKTESRMLHCWSQ